MAAARPQPQEAAPYYFTYIDKVPAGDIVDRIELQLEQLPAWLATLSEEKSLRRYAPDKWSIRQVLNHVSDTERAFAFRALWFARGFDTPLPSYDQEISAAGAQADHFSWASHIADFRAVRQSTLTLFRNMPEEAWMRSGIASGNPFTVRALAYIIAGHVEHHAGLIRERYL
jgi:uncharacterized damage-inducible protein DinB